MLFISADDVVWQCQYCNHFVTMYCIYVGSMWLCMWVGGWVW